MYSDIAYYRSRIYCKLGEAYDELENLTYFFHKHNLAACMIYPNCKPWENELVETYNTLIHKTDTMTNDIHILICHRYDDYAAEVTVQQIEDMIYTYLDKVIDICDRMMNETDADLFKLSRVDWIAYEKRDVHFARVIRAAIYMLSYGLSNRVQITMYDTTNENKDIRKFIQTVKDEEVGRGTFSVIERFQYLVSSILHTYYQEYCMEEDINMIRMKGGC